MSKQTYVSLPGRGRGLTGVSRLWLGSDHVLSVQSQGYAESYKRFFFADIQAIVIARTHSGKIWNGCLAFLAVVFLLLAIPIAAEPAAAVLWTIAVILLVSLAINAALGPTCVCHVRTAVQTERLNSLGRLKTANRVVRQLQPLIVAAQGELPTDQPGAALYPGTAAPPNPAVADQ